MVYTLKKYNRLQFAAKFHSNFRGPILHHSEILKFMRKFEFLECFVSSFFYSNDVLDYLKNHKINGKPSISGYEGPVWATYLFIDIDSKDPEKSHQTAQEMISFLTEHWKLPYESVLVYYSGNGFHLIVDRRVFGWVSPSSNLNVIFATMRRELPKLAKITYPETVDQGIGDKQRLIRLPNTTNIKSGLKKVQLTIPELFELSIEDIKQKAKKIKPLYFTDLTGMIPQEYVKSNPKAVAFYKSAVQKVRGRARRVKRVEIRKTISDSEDPVKYLCPARQGLWKNKIEEEHRHNCAIRLVAQFRIIGVSEKRSRDLIFMWNKTNEINLPSKELNDIVKYVYAVRTPYVYGCSYEKLQEFCPYQDKSKCKYYREFESASLVK